MCIMSFVNCVWPTYYTQYALTLDELQYVALKCYCTHGLHVHLDAQRFIVDFHQIYISGCGIT